MINKFLLKRFLVFLVLGLTFCFHQRLQACDSSGEENGVPKCEDNRNNAITHYFMSYPNFEKWHRCGKKFADHQGDGSVDFYTSDKGAIVGWASECDNTGYLVYGPYLRFDFPGSILVKFYLRATVYKHPHRGWDNLDFFTLDLVSHQGSLVRKVYRISDFTNCEDLGRGYFNCFFSENPAIGIGTEGVKFPKGTSCAHLSTVIQNGVSGFEARVERNTNLVSIVVSKIVITYMRSAN